MMRGHRWCCAVALAWTLVVAAPAAHAATVPVDALGPLGDEHVVFPPYESDSYGPPDATVANAGDVNGDGVDDTAMLLNGPSSEAYSGVWVTFTPTTLPSTMAAGEPGWSGMRITGMSYAPAVAGVGDVNGDGLGDVAVGTWETIYVVFGRRDGGTVDVNDLGDGGFRITGINLGSGFGFGTATGGLAYENTTLTSAGDQNGDGRPDVAFVDGKSVRVVYTPSNPAGATVDASSLGDGGFTLATGAASNDWGGPYVARLGDLDGDGREDLLVVWSTNGDSTSRGVGVASPGPGATVDLLSAVDDGKAFELDAPNSYVENGISVGDQNGDGRRDVALGVVDRTSHERWLALGYSPALGVKRSILPAADGEGDDFQPYDSNVIDVGDQDGDGRSDIAFSDVVRFSGRGEIGPYNPVGPGGALYLTEGSIIVGSVADRNGDGKRELITVHAQPYEMETPPYLATWMLDVFQSAQAPIPDEVEPPVAIGDGLEFDGSFETAGDGMRSLGARPSVELTRPDGSTDTVASSKIVDASRSVTRARVTVDPRAAGLVPGKRYAYRLMLENGRGLVGRSARRSFVYRNSIRGTAKADRLTGTAAADEILGLDGADVLRAGGGADVLRGGNGGDALYGEAGPDHLMGGPGDDVLKGGAGRNTYFGGRGDDRILAANGARDWIDCGPGSHDRARVDPDDDVRNCDVVVIVH